MTRVKVIDFPIFPAKVHVIFTDKPMQIVYESSRKRVFDNFTHNKYGRGGVWVYEAVGGTTTCIIFIHSLNPDDLLPNTIAHECEHAKDYLMAAWGIESDDSEINAYLLDWLVQQVTHFVHGTKPPRVGAKARWKQVPEEKGSACTRRNKR